MKKHTNIILAIMVMAIFAATTAHAQELVYGQRDNQVSYDGKVGSVPATAFNGKDSAAFYYWVGVGDANSGLYMRRIDSSGKPFGPQRKLIDINLKSNLGTPWMSAVWDGSAYIVFAVTVNPVKWYVVRVDAKGKVLGQHTATDSINQFLARELFSFVVGDRAILFFTTNKDDIIGTPYMISVDRELKQKPTLTTLSTAGMKNATIMGAALDPDKILLFLGQFTTQGFELKEAGLLHVDFEGKVKQTIQPSTPENAKTGVAKQLQTFDLKEAAGPVYTGDGYILAGTRVSPIPGTSYPFINSSVKIDETGQIIDGPYNLGGTYRYSLGKPHFFGQHFGLLTTDLFSSVVQVSLLGARGKHVDNVVVHESSAAFNPESVDTVYTGNGSSVVYSTRKNPTTSAEGTAIYSNMITNPASAKPKVVYFQASSGSPYGDTRKLVMWSVSAGTKVSLTGPKLKLKNVPPVFHTVIDTKGKKTKLRLRYTGTDGKARKSKIVIKP